MLRHRKIIGVLSCAFLLGFWGTTGIAQTTPPPPPPPPAPSGSQQAVIDALTNSTQVTTEQLQTTGLDTEAVRKAIEQMDEMVRISTENDINMKPVFDGKNLIFNVHGAIYTFDIMEEARKTSEALTTLDVIPVAPRAHEHVEIKMTNYSTRTDEDRITWAVNGSVVQDQIGGTSIHLTMGDIGEPTRILVTIFSRKLNEFFSKELIITPADVGVLWEANTYTPPFYKGKPLPSYRSTIKLIPFPTIIVGGRTVPPENLLYTWTRNYRKVPELSGYGKRYSFFENEGILREERLNLSVSHPDSGAKTEREVVIGIVQPKILLYAGSPLQGIRYEQALGKTLLLGTQETTLKGEPFFVSNEEISDGSSPLKWKQNGKDIPSLYRSVVLQKPDASGSSRIEASLRNPKRILQSAQAGITITYQGN